MNNRGTIQPQGDGGELKGQKEMRQTCDCGKRGQAVPGSVFTPSEPVVTSKCATPTPVFTFRGRDEESR